MSCEPVKAVCVSVCGGISVASFLPPCDSGSPFLNPEEKGVYD